MNEKKPNDLVTFFAYGLGGGLCILLGLILTITGFSYNAFQQNIQGVSGTYYLVIGIILIIGGWYLRWKGKIRSKIHHLRIG